jgi:hypothetical protein
MFLFPVADNGFDIAIMMAHSSLELLQVFLFPQRGSLFAFPLS